MSHSIPEDLRDANTVAVAYIDAGGALLAANRGFLSLLPAAAQAKAQADMAAAGNVAQFFINPRFAELVAMLPSADGVVFAGAFTCGEYAGKNRGLTGRMRRQGATLHFVAERDIDAMDALQESVLTLNTELADSRRQVARANRGLEALVARRTAALAASESRYRSLVEQSLVGIGIIQAGHFRYANPALVALAGHAAAKAMPSGLRLEALVAPADRERVVTDMARLEAGETPASDLLFTGLRDDGSRFDVEGHCSPCEFEGAPAVIAILLDVTERKRTEIELQRARQAAETASRAKSAFLSTISHELRTPMHQIIGGAELLRRASLTKEQMRNLDMVDRAARELWRGISGILDVTELAGESPGLAESDFSPAVVLATVRDLQAGQATAKGLGFGIAVAPEVPLMVHGDATRLTQALLNFAANGIKFTAHGGVTLAVHALQTDEAGVLLRFEVRDTGVGIPPESRERLFSAFAQADDSSTRRHGGMGLGLAISRQLARLLGGDVGFESTAGKGSTFWLTARFARAAGIAVLPTDDAPAPAAAARPAAVPDALPQARSPDQHTLGGLLNQIEKLLEQDDYRALQAVRESAPALAAAGAEAATLVARVERFDYAAALVTLRGIRDALQRR